ncbi:hypothetical protein KUV23_04350 [Algoriphagus marincola]|uniref:Immunity protein 50 n=1 Tax=Algoriphagus marincola TaxID=264027 RepID=A0ABS7N1I6_9BACT|nr:hypothetical protein [Algoriphagus marincola]MBY5950190.1 hypothetical protein [Algoriphagus marincola]
MQDVWIFEFPTTSNEREQVLKLLKEKVNELEIFLSFHFKSEGAVVEEVKALPDSMTIKGDSGTLILEYELIHFNACLDIHETNVEKLVIQFEIDRSKELLKVKGPERLERGMDEI